MEATLNTLSGFVVSFLMWALVVAPLFHVPFNFLDSFAITCIFTITSVLRSYVWRRFFNKRLLKVSHT